MAQGRIVKFFKDRGFGFIQDAADNSELFFHIRHLRGIEEAEVQVGLDVQFNKGEGRKGPEAVDVSPAGSPPRERPSGGASRPRGRRPRGGPRNRPSRASAGAATGEIPLPRSTQRLIKKPLESGLAHPGLVLDRYLAPGDQKQQRLALQNAIKARGDDEVFRDLLARRRSWLEASGARIWRLATAGPLTLHLSRASALENAGLCLHSIFGFACLPRSGLKGMARAYASQIERADPALIERVLGNEQESSRQSVGGVVFHDAWPDRWPDLTLDIVNNHHPRYYSGEDAPGDWDSPNPVYFLAVRPETTFEFAVAGRRGGEDSEQMLNHAVHWLNGALVQLGCGAKTAAGYGYFSPAAPASLPEQAGRLRSEVTLELVTPAFLAGAVQDQHDCDLRPATLRGLLRQWWRTLHAGYLSWRELTALEAALWGDTVEGGAILMQLEAGQPSAITIHQHDHALPGWRYIAYGMAEKNQKRYRREPGATWKLTFTARKSRFALRRDDLPDPKKTAIEIPAEVVLEQAGAALFLLTNYGGVGSKARKGFGSLELAQGSAIDGGLQGCQKAAENLRKRLGLAETFDEAKATSACLFDPHRVLKEMTIPSRNVTQVLDAVGRAYQGVASAADMKHNPDKAAWGLPRKIHGPRDDKPLPRQDEESWKPPVWLDFVKREKDKLQDKPQDARHASPIHLHVARAENGWVIRLLAMPAHDLPDRQKSIRMLEEFAERFGDELGRQLSQGPRPQPGGGKPASSSQQRPGGISPGDRVEAVLLEEKTRKGGWKALHEKTGLTGPIQNTGEVPADQSAGDRVTLVVAFVNVSEIAFRWPKDSS